MYDRAKEQQKEIATIKERTIYLNVDQHIIICHFQRNK